MKVSMFHFGVHKEDDLVKDIIKTPDKNLGAVGRVCIDYKDPLTGKIKEQIKGDNYVYKDCLFSGAAWWGTLLKANMYITDSRRTINANIPYLFGSPIGYGIPNTEGSGLYRGAWNSVTSFLDKQSPNGRSSKFVYDFTPFQALGTVGTIGLTQQYWYGTSSDTYVPYKFLETAPTLLLDSGGTLGFVVGHYHYTINASAVVIKTNLISYSVTTTDVSGIVGTSSTERLGYEPSTGHFYIFNYSSTAANRVLYEFEDDNFSSAINTWPVSLCTSNNAFYIHGEYMYFLGKVKFNYVRNDTPPSGISMTNSALLGKTLDFRFATNYNNLIIFFGSSYGGSYGNQVGGIFDLDTESIVGYLVSPTVTSYPFFIPDTQILAGYSSVEAGYYIRYISAFTAYRVSNDAPERPEGYGMTITYELEVLY